MGRREYTESEILQKAAAYCAVAERCTQEVCAKLHAWGMQEADCQEAVVRYLVQNGYLSAERYCRAYVHDKLCYQGWGRVKIGLMLRQKGLPEVCVTAALSEIDEEEYNRVLSGLLQKKARSLKKETGDMLRLKLLRFAASRGFDYHEADAALRGLETDG